MNNFNRLKSSANALAILKSGLFGIAAGLFTFGGTLLVTKLIAAKFALVYIALIAAGVAIAVTTGLVLLLRLSNMRFAKLLDNENSLDEKVQTMVAFANETSDMLTLQREDTESILATVRPKKSPIKQLLIPIVSLLLSAALLIPVPVFFVTADKPEEDGETPTYVEPFKISSWQLGALTTLIEDVEKSTAYDNVKADTAKELNRLLRVLKNTAVKDLMYSEVIASIVAVDLIAENAHTYKALCVALYSAEATPVKSLARQVLNVNGLAFGEWMGEFRELYRGDTIKLPEQQPAPPEGSEEGATREADEPIVLETLEEKILALASGIKGTLSPLQGYEDDALYTALLAFANEMEATLSIEDAVIKQTAIDKAFANASTDISAALSAQYRNKALRDTVVKQLISIFKIPEYMIPPLLGDQIPTLEDGSGEGNDDENNNGATGGYGEGNNLYGSNDLIFDPNAEDGPAYVIYGDSFDFYYRSIESLLLYGNLSDETKSILIDYFRKLSDGRGQN